MLHAQIQPARSLKVAGLRLAAVVAPCLQSGLADRLVDVDGGDVHTALVDVASALAHGGGVGQPFGERE